MKLSQRRMDEMAALLDATHKEKPKHWGWKTESFHACRERIATALDTGKAYRKIDMDRDIRWLRNDG